MGFLLPAGVLLELLAIASGLPWLSYLACASFLIYFGAVYPRLNRYVQILVGITAATLSIVAALGKLSLGHLAQVAESAAFYAAFLGSLGLMQCLVRRIELLRRIHDVLLGGRTFWLYPKYALTSGTIASVLNFGVLNMLCGGLSELLDQRGIHGKDRRRWLRCLLGVTLRGFTLVPLIAPTSVAVAIITREVPTLAWSQLLPYTAVAAAVFVVVGWIQERHSFRVVSQQRTSLVGVPRGAVTLGLLMASLLMSMALIVGLTDLNVSRAAMLMVPTLTVVFLLARERRPRDTLREVTGSLVALRNEMCIFASSAALGGTLVQVVLSVWLGGPGALSSQPEFVLAVAGMLMLPAAAAIGISPIVVLSFLAGLLAQVHDAGISPLAIAVGFVIGFSLAMMLSPFGPAVMTLSRFGHIPRTTVAFIWNGRFVLACLPLLLLLLLSI